MNGEMASRRNRQGYLWVDATARTVLNLSLGDADEQLAFPP
jgi:hypothetical protein